MSEPSGIQQANVSRRLLILGYGSTVDRSSEEDHRKAVRRYGVFMEVLLAFQPNIRVDVILVGPTGVVKANCDGVKEGDTSLEAVQVLSRRKVIYNVVNCLSLTPDSMSILPWMQCLRATMILNLSSAIQIIKNKTNSSKVMPEDKTIAQEWNDTMQVRLAHGEGK